MTKDEQARARGRDSEEPAPATTPAARSSAEPATTPATEPATAGAKLFCTGPVTKPESHAVPALTTAEIDQAFREQMTPLIFRGTLMFLQVAGKGYIVSLQGREALATYTTLTALESINYILLYEPLGALTTEFSAVLAKAEKPGFDPLEVGASFRRGLFFAGGLAACGWVVCAAAPLLFRANGNSDAVVDLSQDYFLASIPYCFTDTLLRAMVRFVISHNRAAWGVAADMGEGVVDLGLTYALGHGALGLPKLGLLAPPVAYDVASALTCGAFGYFISRQPEFQQYQLFNFRNQTWDREKMLRLIGAGGKLALITVFDCAADSVVNLLISRYPRSPIAAFAPAIACALFNGYTMGAAAEVPNMLITAGKEKQQPGLYEIARRGIQYGIVFTAIVGAIEICARTEIAKLYLGQDASDGLVTSGEHFLAIEVFKNLFKTISFFAMYSLLGYGISSYSAWASFANLFCTNIALAITAHALGASPERVAATQLVGNFMYAVSLLWKLPVLRESNQSISQAPVAPSVGTVIRHTPPASTHGEARVVEVESHEAEADIGAAPPVKAKTAVALR